MRIALDARTLFSPQRRGIGKSLHRLYQRLGAVRPDWQVYAYHRNPGDVPNNLPANFVPRFVEMPGDRYDAWTQLRLPTAAWLDKADVLHSPANACPHWMPVPTVVTLHDLIPLDIPEGRPSVELRRFEQAVGSACSKAAAVVSPSKYTRRRLVKEHGLNAKRGIVVPWGVTVEQETLDVHDVDMTLRRYGIDRQYMLHLGAGEPRKNTRGVIEAWAMVRPAYRKSWQLLIVGLDDATRESIERLCRALGIQDQVLLHGFAKEAELPVLLSAASALLYPSLSEGFGLPILEAFAVATPVLTSDTTSLPEVAGDAAELVPPGIATALSSAVTRLMKDPMRRGELVERGTHRLTQYRWADAAEQYAQVLEIAARSRRRHRRGEGKRSAA
ncbi:MAG: glycosyltransferase family 4 protein [Phycisphaeraceae bacterium]|nr:glycosyltransferase family 4 protein [Phycisphaeraceae bacterium]